MQRTPKFRDAESNGKFEIQHYKLFLTYKTHIDKEKYTAFLSTERFLPWKEVFIAHETGKNGDYPHSHVYIDFGRKFKSQNSRVLDFTPSEGENPIHPNISFIQDKNLDYTWRYLCKEDHSLDMLLTRCKDNGMSIARETWSKASIHEALELAEKPGDVAGLAMLYKMKPKEPKEVLELKLRPWQETLYSDLLKKPDDRKIIWYIDRAGAQGKTQFCSWFRAKHDCIILTQMGGGRDAATIIKGFLDRGWDQKCVLVDLPRKAQFHSIYEPIEMIKNGCMTTVKYEGETLEFSHPHVVVFANFPPDMSAMSRDRWVIRDITPTNWSPLDDMYDSCTCKDVVISKGTITCMCGRVITAEHRPSFVNYGA